MVRLRRRCQVKPARRVPFVFGALAASVLALAACAPKLNEQDVTTRLSSQLNLPASAISVRSISRDSRPVATVDYGGAVADVRFRRQDGTWVIDAVARSG